MLDFAQHRLRATGINTVGIMLVQRHHDSNENRGCSQPRICLGYFLALGDNEEAANSGRPLSLVCIFTDLPDSGNDTLEGPTELLSVPASR
ncbi:hypothetical protein IVB33_25540 [Bradyrhizobium sp. 24]|nr:hypothetical protein [Bradyrhizobium sp. 24]